MDMSTSFFSNLFGKQRTHHLSFQRANNCSTKKVWAPLCYHSGVRQPGLKVFFFSFPHSYLHHLVDIMKKPRVLLQPCWYFCRFLPNQSRRYIFKSRGGSINCLFISLFWTPKFWREGAKSPSGLDPPPPPLTIEGLACTKNRCHSRGNLKFTKWKLLLFWDKVIEFFGYLI